MLPPHGTPARYQDKLCKCDRCRAAHTARHRGYVEAYQAASVVAPAHGDPWTPEEDAALVELRAIQASRVLGRTYHACVARLTRLGRSL